MNRALLEQPFSPEQIKQRAGNFGQTLDYIEGWAVIQRLNESFDGQWSFQVDSHEVHESEVIVLGKLTAEGITKTQFGSSSVTRNKNTGEIISLAGDLKAAATDSLKKCATMFGVGLHLYGAASKPALNDPFQPADKPGDRSPGDNGNGGNGKGNGGTRLSQKQHSFLLRLADERGVSRKNLDDMSKERFGCVVTFLSKSEACSLIGEMTTN